MNVVPFPTSAADAHSATRDAFAQAAYAGDLPREQWIPAQRLVAEYDACEARGDRDGRRDAAARMDAMRAAPRRVAV